MTSAHPPEPSPSLSSQDAESTRNERPSHAFGFRWQQHHNTKVGLVDSMQLRVRQKTAPTARGIEDVASRTRHCPMNAICPALN